jgi:hypothetical protein
MQIRIKKMPMRIQEKILMRMQIRIHALTVNVVFAATSTDICM